MQISYKKLFKMLVDQDLKPISLSKKLGMASSTMYKLRKNEVVALEILIRICTHFNCQLSDIAELQAVADVNEI